MMMFGNHLRKTENGKIQLWMQVCEWIEENEWIDKGLFQYIAEEEISSNMSIKKEKIENEYDNLDIQEDDFL